jgi:F-type H+-transporting ATPase subunit delta
MGPAIIARNYAETLLALAHKHGGDATVDEYGRALHAVAELLRENPRVEKFLATPRIGGDARKDALRVAFEGRVPDLFLRFVLVVVAKRRQMLLREIAAEYQALVDEARGRVRAQVTVAREPDEALRHEITESLEKRLGKTVTAEISVDPELLGGIVVRVGDQVLDGSLRNRIGGLRRRMMSARLPRAAMAVPE